MQRTESLEKTLMLGKIDCRRRRGWQRMRWLDGITDSMDMGLGGLRSWWWTGRPGVLWFMGLQKLRHDWVTELKEKISFLVEHLLCTLCSNPISGVRNFKYINFSNYHNNPVRYCWHFTCYENWDSELGPICLSHISTQGWDQKFSLGVLTPKSMYS